MKKLVVFAGLIALGISIFASMPAAEIIDSGRHHLRTGLKAEWDTFESDIPEGDRLEIHFQARTNQSERTLFIDQSDVKWDWSVDINGRRLGNLFPMEYDVVQTLPIPAGTLRDGQNFLRILPPSQSEDIIISKLSMVDAPPAEAIGEASLRIKVKDERGAPIPCRITVADANDRLVPIWPAPGQKLAVRPGVVYTGTGEASLGVRAGEYFVYATRGFEYSLAQRKIKVRKGDTRTINLNIRHEVLLSALASCDTHIHTVTYSKHGDATIEERVLTLAGEDIELPVATEHNLQIDYSSEMGAMGVEGWFTPIRGNEITTSFGHFNAFPISAQDHLADYTLTDWPTLMESIRATPGVEIVVLNHPRNLHAGFVPFARTNFNNTTGENLRGPEYTFDAIELINSGALRSDFMQVYRDWFALLDYGYRITGVGASDSHDVSRYIVGQGRTYIYCGHPNPGQIDLKQVTASLRSGRALVSLGLLTEMTVNDRYKSGDLVSVDDRDLRVNVKVFAPAWITATNLALYANGERIREETIGPRHSRNGLQSNVTWVLPNPHHDLNLVAVATGPGVSKPYWAIAKPYQPESPHWEPLVIGSTNPIWIDADHDGRYNSPRAYAKNLMEKTGANPRKVIERLADFDRATAIQTASLLHAAGIDVVSAAAERFLDGAPEFVRAGFRAYAASIGK